MGADVASMTHTITATHQCINTHVIISLSKCSWYVHHGMQGSPLTRVSNFSRVHIASTAVCAYWVSLRLLLTYRRLTQYARA